MAFESLGTIVDRVLQNAGKRCGGRQGPERRSPIYGPAKCVFGDMTPIKPANQNGRAAHPGKGGQHRMRR